MDKMRYGEDAHRGGESRSWSGAAIAGRERLDQGLEGFQGAALDYAPGSSRNERGAGPTAGSEIRRGPVLESVDARPSPTTSRRTRYPRLAGAPGFSRRSDPKVDMVLAAGPSRSTTPIDPTLDVAGSR